jgi:hypothetical protein
MAMALTVGLALSLAGSACREEGAMEKAGRKIDEAMEDANREAADAMKEAGEAMDEAARKMDE